MAKWKSTKGQTTIYKSYKQSKRSSNTTPLKARVNPGGTLGSVASLMAVWMVHVCFVQYKQVKIFEDLSDLIITWRPCYLLLKLHKQHKKKQYILMFFISSFIAFYKELYTRLISNKVMQTWHIIFNWCQPKLNRSNCHVFILSYLTFWSVGLLT
jgi:hypothetical protein